MDALKINHSILKFVAVCDVKESTSFAIKLRNQLFYYLVAVMHLINAVISGLYPIIYFSLDYSGSMYGFLATAVSLCNFYMLVTLRYHSKQMGTESN